MTNFNHLSKAASKLINGGALALIAGLSLTMAPQAFADDCLLDTNNNGDVDLTDTDGGADSGGIDFNLACGVGANAAGLSTAVGHNASAVGERSMALGSSASAAGLNSIALGHDNSAGGSGSIAVGRSANAAWLSSIAFGSSALTGGSHSIALGSSSFAGLHAVAIGSDGDFNGAGARAFGDNSIAVGADATDSNFADAIVIGFGATATEADQVILKSADVFTILGNGDVGIGTAAPLGNLDINSGAADTVLLLNNTSAQWELKSKASTGRLNFKNLTDGGVPFKLGPSAVNSLLSVGTMADDLVEVRGELMVEGNVDVTGTLTTGGPTCGGGCDAVFGADYDLPSIEEHATQMFANSYLPEVGPTVPHAPMNISETVGTMLNELEKAHIYIADLDKRNKALAQEKQVLADQLARQETRLAKLEARLNSQ